jgi:hypothetical protein
MRLQGQDVFVLPILKFVAGIFTQIKPVWIGVLETKPKINGWGFIFFISIGEFFV